MNVRDILALNLRKRRTQQGLSQRELADRAEIDRTYVSALERGAYAASIDVVARLAQVFDLKSPDLLTHPALQQGPDQLSRACPPIGSGGNHVVEIPVSTIPLHECGALLLSYFAFPTISSDEYWRRTQAETAICNIILRRKAEDDPGWALSAQTIRPSYMLLSQRDARRSLRTFNRRIHHRFAVARLAGLMLVEGLDEAWLKKPPEGGKHLSIEEASELLANLVGEKGTRNIASRIWASSFPVAHLALVLIMLARRAASTGRRGHMLSELCFNREALLYVLEGAEQFEFALSYSPTLRRGLIRLLQFRAT